MRRVALLGSAAAVALLVSAAPPAYAAPGPSDAPEYWFDNWQVESLWAQGARGQGITIAEIDTGVNASLPELAGNVLSGEDFGASGNGQVDRESSNFGHGTAMASIMVGQRGILGITGLAPGAKLLPIAVPLNGTTDASHEDKLAAAITWAADHGGKVISMSLGGGRTPSDGPDPCPSDEQAAIYHALAKGDIVVAASGNSGPTVNTVEEPGVCLGVVSVGAVDGAGVVASFSSRHPYLTMTAPGVNVASLSRIPGSAYSGDGTSQATAIASAVFALVWSKYPKLTGDQVIARVLATLDGKRATRDPAYGYGEIDAYRAVTASVAANASDPVYAAARPFMDRANAFTAAAKLSPPAHAGSGNVSFGKVSVGSSPRLRTRMVLTGLALAAAGLVVLIALASGGGIARRRRRRAEHEELLRSLQPAQTAPSDDSYEMFWRDIVVPPQGSPASMYPSNTPDPPSGDWWAGPARQD